MSQSNDLPRRRRLDGWGFEGETYPPSAQLLHWLEARLGKTTPLPKADPSRLRPSPPQSLPQLSAPTSQDPRDRLAHSRGQGLTDLVRIRTGTVPALPDAVVRPRDDAEVETALRRCTEAGVRVIPWGGGTSVTGGVNVIATDSPVVTLDLEYLSGVEGIDETSGLATFGAGTLGPGIEAGLAERGFTLGHFPQSWELSTLGGWIATRSSGQESLSYGSIENLVAGLEMVAPAGRIVLPSFPRTAAGPDLRQLVLGSEGRLGVITRATVRVRHQPEKIEVVATLLPSWENGLQAARELLQQNVPLTLLRLSDESETEVAMAIGLASHRRVAPVVRGWLKLRGATENGCMMLYGAAGDRGEIRRTLREARSVLRRHGGVSLGTGPGRHWLADRFRHPYLRDSLLDLGIATDTLETAAPWSRLPDMTRAVRRALTSALESENERVAVLGHVSHPYSDGSSLYFTFFYRSPSDPEAAVARWATVKRAATSAIMASGGTLSHHHGVGSWHAPWLEKEVGEQGMRVLRAIAATLDPAVILNPHVLLDPMERLEA